MTPRSLLLTTALALASTASITHAQTVNKVTNDRVRVTEITLAPGTFDPRTEHRPAFDVFLDDATLAASRAGSPLHPLLVHRGDVLFDPAQSGPMRNDSAAAIRFVRVEFLNDGSSETWGTTGLPPNDKIALENRYARAYDILIAPHQREPQHSHRDRIVIILSGGRIEHTSPDGTKATETLTPDEIAWHTAVSHAGHNLGDTQLHILAIEPKS